MVKTQRQGLATTPKELRQLADEMEQELDNCPVTLTPEGKASIKHILTIINNDGCSDTWRFE